MKVPNDPGCTFLVRRPPRPADASRAGYDAVMPEIGLVGLGRMGLPICANLVRAGYRVLAGDRRPETARQAAGYGARWVPEVGRLAAGADILITVLPGPGEVRELMLGTGGAVAALRPGTTWIDMTSNSPAAVTEIRDALLDRGVQVLDAPPGGGVTAARQGRLQLLVGGEAAVVARHRDLLEILGSPGRVRHVGGYGAGYTAKLLINLLWFGQAVATAEALLLGRASGLDLAVLREVLADSAAGTEFIRRDLDALFAGDFMRTFGLDRCCEELQIVTELARGHHLPFQVSESVADLYRQALRRYGPADGELLGVALLEEQAGLQLRHPPAARGPVRGSHDALRTAPAADPPAHAGTRRRGHRAAAGGRGGPGHRGAERRFRSSASLAGPAAVGIRRCLLRG
jgi:3-hydroxyisobutyrate dehydrogenase